MSDERFVGWRGEDGRARVRIDRDDGAARLLPARTDIVNHSPDGFEFGYGGSGPAQLALAMCAHAAGDVVARQVYQQFKREVVAVLPRDGWTLGVEVVRNRVRALQIEREMAQ